MKLETVFELLQPAFTITILVPVHNHEKNRFSPHDRPGEFLPEY